MPAASVPTTLLPPRCIPSPSPPTPPLLPTHPSPPPPTPTATPTPILTPTPLHSHVRLISSYLGPTPSDRLHRHRVLSELTQLILSAYPHVEVHVIGSCATELYLPDSDIDLVVRAAPTHTPLTLSDLHHLGSVLQPVASSLHIISTASVPLIKLTHALSAFTIDLTLNVDTGLHSTHLTLDYLHAHDTLQPLAIVVKQFLKARGLNDLYTGGLPSYTLILLIVSFLQLYRPARGRAAVQEGEDGGQGHDGSATAAGKGGEREERKEEIDDGRGMEGAEAVADGRWRRTRLVVTPSLTSCSTSSSSSSSQPVPPRTSTSSPIPIPSPSPPSPLTPSSTSSSSLSSSLSSPPPPPADLGLYLLSFFHLYGLSFDYVHLGISTALPGYFLKRERGFFHPHIPHLLCVENPLDRSMDLGFKVFRIREIVDAFAQAYATLVDRMGVGPQGGGPSLRRPYADTGAVAPVGHGGRQAEQEGGELREPSSEEMKHVAGGGGGREGDDLGKAIAAGAGAAVEPSMNGARRSVEPQDAGRRVPERGVAGGEAVHPRRPGRGHSRRSSDGQFRPAAAAATPSTAPHPP